MKDMHYFKSHPGSWSHNLASQLLITLEAPLLVAALSEETECTFWRAYP